MNYPLDRLDALPHMLRGKYPRWAVIATGQLCEDEALHLEDRLVALGLEARSHREPATGFTTFAREVKP